MLEYGMETFPIAGTRKVEIAANSEKSDCP
jgi:hypothetical protein